MKFVVRVEGRERTVVVAQVNGVFEIEINGRPVNVDCRYLGDTGYLSLLIDNRSHRIETEPVNPGEGRYYARVHGRHYDVDVLDDLLIAVRNAEKVPAHTGRHVVVAPMPGLVVDVRVQVGDHVEAGAAVVIMEAMKMQNELRADAGGVVTAVHVKEKDTVESQAPLVVIERE